MQTDLLISGMKQLNISITEKQITQFQKYFEMLIEKNKVMNLTSITEESEVIVKHFLDSILVSSVFNLNKTNTLVDVGTGAGFPGIPLKIMFPHLKVTLLDSLNKRLKFLDEVISELELEEIYTVHGRAEDCGRNIQYREQYDLCVSRAVANLSTLSEYCIPFVKVGGNFVSYKSSMSEQEISSSEKAINILGGKIKNTSKVQLPCSDMERVFVIIEKQKNTGKKFPRKAGVPSKEPIH